MIEFPRNQSPDEGGFLLKHAMVLISSEYNNPIPLSYTHTSMLLSLEYWNHKHHNLLDYELISNDLHKRVPSLEKRK